MSSLRREKRANKPKSDGIIPLHKRKVKKSMQNEGGFYNGMPGCTLDELGNRKMIDFIVQESGYTTARVYAHPKIIKVAVQQACKNNRELSGIVLGAAIDTVFQSKRPLDLIIRFGLYLRRRRNYRKLKRKQKNND